MGRINGTFMGAATAYDAAISSDLVRYGIMGGSALTGLWGMSDPGGMGGLQGAIGVAGLAGAGFAAGGAWGNSASGLEWRNAHMVTRGPGRKNAVLVGADGVASKIWGAGERPSVFNRHFAHSFNNSYAWASDTMEGAKAYGGGWTTQAGHYADKAQGYALGIADRVKDSLPAGAIQ